MGVAVNWKPICKLSDLREGELREMDVDHIKMLLVRSGERVFAYPPLCPHMEEPLVYGMCDGKTLTCTKHLWQWNLSTGEAEGISEKPLLMYDVKIEGDVVYVHADVELQYDYDSA